MPREIASAPHLLDDRVLPLALHLEGWVVRLAILGNLLALGLDGGLLGVLFSHLTYGIEKEVRARKNATLAGVQQNGVVPLPQDPGPSSPAYK